MSIFQIHRPTITFTRNTVTEKQRENSIYFYGNVIVEMHIFYICRKICIMILNIHVNEFMINVFPFLL